MSDAQIAKLHRDLATLQSGAARQQKHQKEIQGAAKKMLETVNQRLSEVKAFEEPDEYQSLLTEKGVLEQVLARP